MVMIYMMCCDDSEANDDAQSEGIECVDFWVSNLNGDAVCTSTRTRLRSHPGKNPRHSWQSPNSPPHSQPCTSFHSLSVGSTRLTFTAADLVPVHASKRKTPRDTDGTNHSCKYAVGKLLIFKSTDVSVIATLLFGHPLCAPRHHPPSAPCGAHCFIFFFFATHCFLFNKQYSPYDLASSKTPPGSQMSRLHHWLPAASRNGVQNSRSHSGLDAQSGSVGVGGCDGR